MTMSLYFYVWINRRDKGRTFRQSYATWKRFHLYRVENGWTPDLAS
jgi:hypothetical protein